MITPTLFSPLDYKAMLGRAGYNEVENSCRISLNICDQNDMVPVEQLPCLDGVNSMEALTQLALSNLVVNLGYSCFGARIF